MKKILFKLAAPLLLAGFFVSLGLGTGGCKVCYVTVYDTVRLVDTIHIINITDSVRWVFDTVIIRDTVKEIKVQAWDNYFINISSLNDCTKVDVRRIIEDILKRCETWE